MSRNRIQDLKQQVERLNALSGVSNRNAEAIEYTLESLQDYLNDLDSSMAQIRDTTTKLTRARKNVMDTLVEVETIQGKFAEILELKDSLSGRKGQQLLSQSQESFREKVVSLLEQRNYFSSPSHIIFKSTPEILAGTQSSCTDIVSNLEYEFEKSLKLFPSVIEVNKATSKAFLLFCSNCLDELGSSLLPGDSRSGIDRCRSIYIKTRSELVRRIVTDWMTSRRISSPQHIVQENDRLWNDWVSFIIDEMLQTEFKLWAEFGQIFHESASVYTEIAKEIMSVLSSSVSPLVLTATRKDRKKKHQIDEDFNFQKFSFLTRIIILVLVSFHQNANSINAFLIEEGNFNGVDLRSPSTMLVSSSSSSSSSLFQSFVLTRASIQLRLLVECNDLLIWLKDSDISSTSSYCGVDIVTSQTCLEVLDGILRNNDIYENSLKCAIYDVCQSQNPIIVISWPHNTNNRNLMDYITSVMIALCHRIDRRAETMKMAANQSSINTPLDKKHIHDDDDDSMSVASEVPPLPPAVVYENPLAAMLVEEPIPHPMASQPSSVSRIFAKKEEKKVIHEEKPVVPHPKPSGGLFSVFQSSSEKAAAVVASAELIDIDIVFRNQLPRLFFLLNNYHYLIHFMSKQVVNVNVIQFIQGDFIQQLRTKFNDYMKELCKTFGSHLMHQVQDLSDLPSPTSILLSKSDGRKVKGRFECCNVFFEAISSHASEWIVQDLDLKNDIRRNLIRECIPLYTSFYFSYSQVQFSKKHMREYLRFPPNQAETLLNSLF